MLEFRVLRVQLAKSWTYKERLELSRKLLIANGFSGYVCLGSFSTIQDLKSHEKDCTFRPTACPNEERSAYLILGPCTCQPCALEKKITMA